MSRKLRALAAIAVCTAAVYSAGVAALYLTPPPFGWVWLLPLAVLCAFGLRLLERPKEERELRRARGQCERCAYDLRATPHRCPECGRATW
jgi:hypothetical protein